MSALYIDKYHANGYHQHATIRFSSTSEERRVRKRRAAYFDRIMGYKGEWTTAFTLTSGLPEEREDPKIMFSGVMRFLKSLDVDCCAVLDIDSRDNWHVHGLASDLFNLTTWIKEHCCNEDAVYCEPLYYAEQSEESKQEALVKYVYYMLQTIDKIPPYVRGCYTNYRYEKPKVEIHDDRGELVYTNERKKECVNSGMAASGQTDTSEIAPCSNVPSDISENKNIKNGYRKILAHPSEMIPERIVAAFPFWGEGMVEIVAAERFHIYITKKPITRLARGPPDGSLANPNRNIDN